MAHVDSQLCAKVWFYQVTFSLLAHASSLPWLNVFFLVVKNNILCPVDIIALTWPAQLELLSSIVLCALAARRFHRAVRTDLGALHNIKHCFCLGGDVLSLGNFYGS